jgi:MoaA/NifB/PqqE/SkfB family radical SAM enzyme
MCDIWKDNRNVKQLKESDIRHLLTSLRKLGTRQVVMSGGEPLLNENFFRLCEILKNESIKVTLLSTGLTAKHHAENILRWVDDLIVSLDGDEIIHDHIRNIPGAFNKLAQAVQHIKSLKPGYKITGRTVIHRLNFRHWPAIVNSARKMGLDQISFLPADVTSHAFNRMESWSEPRQSEILPALKELPDLQQEIYEFLYEYRSDIRTGFIAESSEKLQKIYSYYAAFYGLNPYPYKRCNAPWVSTVVEADGTVRPCFFHEGIGNIHDDSLDAILNSKEAINFRKTLNTAENSTCMKCVCSLYLSPLASI